MGLIMPLFPAFYSKVTALLGCVQGDKALCKLKCRQRNDGKNDREDFK